jgi:branched-chain amino acid transport system permease protein
MSSLSLLASVVVDSLAYAMVLFVISVGLSITLGLMRFVNLAHGLFAVAGGYALVTLMGRLGWPYELAVFGAIAVVAVLAWPLERWLYRRLAGRSELDQVLFSIALVFIGIAGLGLLFGNAISAVRLPSYLQGSVDLGFRALPAQRLAALGAGVATLALLSWLMQATRFGIELRAAVERPQAAQALGIRTTRVCGLAFALGAALAALGGVVGAELLPLEPHYPLKYLVLFLAVVAVGGLGSHWGLLAAALLLGTVETAAKYFVPGLASILFYTTMLAVLAWRPQGLFGRPA